MFIAGFFLENETKCEEKVEDQSLGKNVRVKLQLINFNQ